MTPLEESYLGWTFDPENIGLIRRYYYFWQSVGWNDWHTYRLGAIARTGQSVQIAD